MLARGGRAAAGRQLGPLFTGPVRDNQDETGIHCTGSVNSGIGPVRVLVLVWPARPAGPMGPASRQTASR